MNENSSRVNTDLVIKLFDTLTDSDKDLRYKVDKQTDAIIALSASVDAIKNDSSKIDSIDKTTKSTNETSNSILSKVKKMASSVRNMIIIVSVAFGLMTLAYFFVNNSIENMIDRKVKSGDVVTDSNKELLKEIEELKKKIQEFHNSGQNKSK